MGDYMNYPKISIVTPNFNGDKYLEQTILSVIEQEYPNLEYILIDGGSSDRSIEIIKNFKNKIAYWISEDDEGLYDALNKGFKKSTGSIMGWLNSDDMLHPNSLFTLAEIFQNESIEWIQGPHSWFDEKGRIYNVEKVKLKSKYSYLLKDYLKVFSPFIQQESTYWKRELWNRAGGYISTGYKYAGDFELWMRFFKQGQMFLTNSLIGGFRYTGKEQLSIVHHDKYLQEADSIVDNYQYTEEEKSNIEFLSSSSFIDYIPFLRKNRFLKKKKLINKFEYYNWNPYLKMFMIK